MKQPYIYHRGAELGLLIGPAFLILALVLAVPQVYLDQLENNVYFWLLVVVFIDVAHVYSTLFRTYFDANARSFYKKQLVAIPVICFLLAFMSHYCFGQLVFWRLLAYTAVFHFIRQQYGFFRIYDRQNQNRMNRMAGNLAIYAATIYPLLHWHLTSITEFNWFVSGDFVFFHSPVLDNICFGIFLGILAFYAYTEMVVFTKTKFFNHPKNLLLLTTLVAWYGGIVVYKSDVVFTLFNVVAHGVPYIAFIVLMGRKDLAGKGFSPDKFSARFYMGFGIFVLVLSILLFAYLEEGLWDWLVWHEHPGIFPYERAAGPEGWLMSVTVALLILPQFTHYVLDGFIWRMRKKNDGWYAVVDKKTDE